MRQLSSSGQQAISNIAQRHGFSEDAVISMFNSVINGNGSMAQFSHPEFGGSGQWMLGGMTMLSDMFNNYLKGRVDNLCADLSALLANQPDLIRHGSFQSQSQGGNDTQFQASHAGWQASPAAPGDGGASLFVPAGPDWWGPDLRWPNSTGAQNGVRYAFFGQARRLAIEINGQVTIYDTLDHQIGGFSQQQSSGGSISFSSQYGLVDIASLPVLSIDGIAPVAPAAPPVQAVYSPAARPAAGSASLETDIFALIERLADLRGKGVLTDSEFATKKAELLARL